MGNLTSLVVDPSYSSQEVTSRRKKGKRLNSLRPKKVRKKEVRQKRNNPPSAYALFIRDVRNRLFDRRITFRELTQSCSRKWNTMSVQEKQRYHTMAKEIRQNMLRVCGPSHRRTLKDPKKRKKTNYWNYAQIMRPVIYNEMKEHMNGRKPQMKEVNRQVGHLWQQMTPQQKDLYKDCQVPNSQN